MKTTIAIEEIQELQKRRLEINKLDINDIVFTEKGQPLVVNEKILEDFKFTGLNNTDFITSEFYKA